MNELKSSRAKNFFGHFTIRCYGIFVTGKIYSLAYNGIIRITASINRVTTCWTFTDTI